MPKICSASGCNHFVFGGSFCKIHQRLRTDKRPKPIQAYSKKRQKVNRKYNPAARQYIIDNPVCVIKSKVCTYWAQGVHHPKGRGEYLMVKEEWMPACNACNGQVEIDHAWAVANDFKKSRHSNNIKS